MPEIQVKIFTFAFGDWGGEKRCAIVIVKSGKTTCDRFEARAETEARKPREIRKRSHVNIKSGETTNVLGFVRYSIYSITLHTYRL